MRVSELLAGVEVLSARYDGDPDIGALCYDSRRVRPGSAFVAMRRASADGHAYIGAALENGASLIVAERPVEGAPCVVVRDGCRALAVMSANFYGRPADRLTVIGITGTKGKTTTAFLVKTVLEQALGVKTGLLGTIQYMAGDEILEASKNTTPETPELHALLSQMLEKGCTHVVMEVSSHSLALDRVYGIPFKLGVFTNLTQDHLDFHKTMQAYLEAKAKLFDMCELGVINLDDPASEYLIGHTKSKKFTVSTQNDAADLVAKNIRFREERGVDFEALVDSDIRRVSLPLPGIFSVYNALSAIGCGLCLGAGLDRIAEALGSAQGVRGRIEVVPVRADYRVIVDYAHTPDSIEKAVSAVRDFTSGRVISVFGCGGNRDRTKRPLMAAAASKLSGFVIVTTDNPRDEAPEDIIADILPGLRDGGCPYEVVVDRREAIRRALELAKPGDTVLLMGKGHETYQEIHGVRRHFDDREEVENYFKTRKNK